MKTVNTSALEQRIIMLRRVLPIVLGAVAVLYETGLGRWIHDTVGAYLYFDLDIVFYALGLPLLVYAVLTLIRDWVVKAERAEHQAQASERQLGSIMAASVDAILSLDAHGRIGSWNRGAESLFGYEDVEIKGKPLAQLLKGDAATTNVEYQWLRQVVRDAGYVRGHETSCLDANGREIDVELTATGLKDDDRFIGMSVVLRDVTERRRREEEIRRLNASLSEQVLARTKELDVKIEQLARANAGLQALDRLRSEFVSVVSHQIRAPLTNMRGAAERMRVDCGTMNVTCSRMFTILEQQAVRLDRLVQDVLNTARIEAGSLVLHTEPISVLPVVQQVVDQMRARMGNREIRVPTKPGLPLAMADRDRAAEILANLLDNADKYSPSGQEICVDVQADQTEITLSVRDHGRGLSNVDLDQLFHKFYRADSSDSQTVYGYGLGLYVCRNLVQAQGGRIWAENATDGGAVFSFTLPVAR
ncbi:MAG: ATP-binding protein [Chloroflexi bacterium]|nr:ATP-binding protein [Chloroflexota bacterium]MCL5275601.1 ATP-binding protein [Chloroflexota bacterium]